MAKYILECTETYETVIPASVMVFHTIHGEQVSDIQLPEKRYITEKGKRTVVKRKADVTRLIKTGKWTLASMP